MKLYRLTDLFSGKFPFHARYYNPGHSDHLRVFKIIKKHPTEQNAFKVDDNIKYGEDEFLPFTDLKTIGWLPINVEAAASEKNEKTIKERFIALMNASGIEHTPQYAERVANSMKKY